MLAQASEFETCTGVFGTDAEAPFDEAVDLAAGGRPDDVPRIKELLAVVLRHISSLQERMRAAVQQETSGR